VSVLVTSITENRTPPTDGIAIDDALTVDSEVDSCGPEEDQLVM